MVRNVDGSRVEAGKDGGNPTKRRLGGRPQQGAIENLHPLNKWWFLEACNVDLAQDPRLRAHENRSFRRKHSFHDSNWSVYDRLGC